MASPSISFTQIPSNKRVPGVYMEENTSNALQGLTPAGNSMILLAQKTSAGSVAANVPTKIFSDSDAQLYFGAGSVAHLGARAALTANPNLDLTVMGLADSGSTYAAGSIGVSGIVGSAGALTIFVGDVAIPVSLALGVTGSQAATGICAAISAYNDLPITAGVTGGNFVTLTAKNSGTNGNFVPVSCSIATGLTGMSFTVTEPTGGATDPDYGDYTVSGSILSTIAGSKYNLIATTLPDSTNMTKLMNLINFQSNAIEQKSVVAVAGVTDQVNTYSGIETLATGQNNGRLTLGYVSYTTGNQLKPIPAKVTAAYAATLTTTTDPVVPYDSLPIIGLPQPNVVDWFTTNQQEDLLRNGVTPIIAIPGNEVAICRAISTYVVNTAGIPDPTLLDINTYRTLDYVRDQVRTRLALRFRRSKLSTRTPAKVKTQVLSVLYELEDLEIVQNVKKYESGVIVEQDSSDVTRLDIKIPTNIVSGLHVLAGVIELILGI